MSLLSPWPLSTAAVLVWIVFYWIAISGIDYHGQPGMESSTTSFWFCFGFPMIVAMGTGFAMLFTWLCRRTSQLLAWLALVVAAALLWGTALPGMTPQAHLARVIGPEAAKLAIVERLEVRDSFSDGTMVSGILSGPPELMTVIRQHRTLTREPSVLLEGTFGREGLLPEYGDVERDDRVTYFVHPGNGKIYFYQRYEDRRASK